MRDASKLRASRADFYPEETVLRIGESTRLSRIPKKPMRSDQGRDLPRRFQWAFRAGAGRENFSDPGARILLALRR
jgi:hypothetical protein